MASLETFSLSENTVQLRAELVSPRIHVPEVGPCKLLFYLQLRAARQTFITLSIREHILQILSTHPNVVVVWLRLLFVFGRSRIQISARIHVILIEVLSGFSQPL
jgi:hypothetical protein